MKKTVPAANPDAYVAALTGWQRAPTSRAVKLNEELGDPTRDARNQRTGQR
jgi:hypothetical protein